MHYRSTKSYLIFFQTRCGSLATGAYLSDVLSEAENTFLRGVGGNGVVSHESMWVEKGGRFGNHDTLSFDGVDQNVFLDSMAPIGGDNAGGGSIVAWVRPTGTNEGIIGCTGMSGFAADSNARTGKGTTMSVTSETMRPKKARRSLRLWKMATTATECMRAGNAFTT